MGRARCGLSISTWLQPSRASRTAAGAEGSDQDDTDNTGTGRPWPGGLLQGHSRGQHHRDAQLSGGVRFATGGAPIRTGSGRCGADGDLQGDGVVHGAPGADALGERRGRCARDERDRRDHRAEQAALRGAKPSLWADGELAAVHLADGTLDLLAPRSSAGHRKVYPGPTAARCWRRATTSGSCVFARSIL